MEDPPEENMSPESQKKQPSRWGEFKNRANAILHGSKGENSAETESLPEIPKKSYEGLIFNNPDAIQEAFSDIQISDVEAEALMGVHLLEESEIAESASGSPMILEENVKTLVDKVREYRKSKGLSLTYPEEELVNIFGAEGKFLSGIDLANTRELLVATKKGQRIDRPSGLDRSDLIMKVYDHIGERVRDDRSEKAETEGRGWNIHLSDATSSIVNTITTYLPEKPTSIRHDVEDRRTQPERPWDGLIFDSPNELTDVIGIDEEAANLLAGTHLWDEEDIARKMLNSGKDSEYIVGPLEIIQKYRNDAGHTFTLSKEELVNNFGNVAENLEGMDLANKTLIEMKLRELGHEQEEIEGIQDRIMTFVRKEAELQHSAHLSEKIKSVSPERSMRDKGAEIIDNFREWLKSDKLSPENKEAIQKFLDKSGSEGKELLYTLKPKDFREIASLTARVAADFVPLAGWGLMTVNLGLIARKEIKTGRRIRKEVGEEYSDTSAFAAYLSQTTIGKILSKESETGLSKRAKIGAGLTGFATSSAGMIAAEAIGEAATIPGAKSIARAVTMRSFLNYFGPRIIDFAASRAATFESEEQKKEWADLALASSSATTTALATGFTIGAIAQSGIGINTTEISEQLEKVGNSIEEVFEDISEQFPPALEGEPVLEGHQSPFEGMATDTELPEAATKPTIPQEAAEQAPPTEATPAAEVNQPANEQHFSNGGFTRYDDDGNLTEAIMDDGRHLILDENSIGIPGLQYKFLEQHSDLSPDEAAVIATRAYAEGITADDVEAVRDYPIPAYEAPSLEIDESLDINKEGSWKYNSQGMVVSGELEDGRNLIFDFNSNGEPGLIAAIANSDPTLSPDQVAEMAHLAAQRGIQPDNIDLNVFDDLEIPTSEPLESPTLDVQNLEEGLGFDENGDGVEDSHWLQNKETGEIEAGVLPDGRTLYLGEEGGVNGVMQETLVHENPNLSPQKVGNIAEQVVVEQELSSAAAVREAITHPEVIETVNSNVARYSLENYLRDTFKIQYSSAHELVSNKIQLDVRGDSLVKLGPGDEALDFLNARVQTDKGIFLWRNFNWSDWLREQGVIS